MPHAPIPATFVRADGTPWPYASVLSHAVSRIVQASHRRRGMRLSASEVRALDWAVIRESGGLGTDGWLAAPPNYDGGDDE